MSRYILDTNIFNRVLEGALDAVEIGKNAVLCATHIELNELQRTRNEELRQQLLDVFEFFGPMLTPTTSAVWGVSEFGGAEFTSEDSYYPGIIDALNKKNGGKENNVHDALIADTAMSLNLTLVTEDQHLLEVVAEAGGSVIRLEEFLVSNGAESPPN